MKPTITIDEYLHLSDDIVIDYVKDKSPLIWHQMILYWERSFPTRLINWSAENSKTSPATAVLIYWKLGSSYNKKFRDRDDYLTYAPYWIEDYDLSIEIEQRLIAGFYKGPAIFFDPKEPDCDGMIWSQEYPNIEDVRGIPSIVYERLKGEKVLENPKFIEGYPRALYIKTTKLRNSYYNK